MKLHYMRDDVLIDLKNNLRDLYTNYRKPDNSWIFERYENPFGEIKTEFPDFKLENQIDTSNTSPTDIRNARILYSALKDLTDTQATDERVWAGLCNCDLYNFEFLRWNNTSHEQFSPEIILTRYFFSRSPRESINRNSLSRLWWLGRWMYAHERKDPFELLRYFEKEISTKMLMIFSNRYMNNKAVGHGLISALLELDDEGYNLHGKYRNTFYEASSYLNIFGGTHILDYYSEDEIKQLVLLHMKSMPGASFSPVNIPDSDYDDSFDEYSDDYLSFDELLSDEVPETEVVSEVHEPVLLTPVHTDNPIRDDFNKYSGTVSTRISDLISWAEQNTQLVFDFPEIDPCAVLRKHGFEVIDNRKKSRDNMGDFQQR